MKKILKTLCVALVAVITGFAVTACKPSNIDKAEAKMEKAGYTVLAYNSVNDADGFVGGFIAMDIAGGESILAILFESKADAEKYAELNKKTEYGESKVEGKWFYAGSERAIEAFKK